MVRPRQPRDARSRTAQTRVRQLVSPGSRPMTLTRRVSPKAPLAQGLGEGLVNRADHPALPSEMTSSGERRPRSASYSSFI